MDLKLDPHGQGVFERWLASRPAEADRRLVAQVLRAVGNKTWYQQGWFYRTETLDEGESVIVIQPRDGLKVAVNLWNPDGGEDTFDLRYIVA